MFKSPYNYVKRRIPERRATVTSYVSTTQSGPRPRWLCVSPQGVAGVQGDAGGLSGLVRRAPTGALITP
jgi:hypothetical protein